MRALSLSILCLCTGIPIHAFAEESAEVWTVPSEFVKCVLENIRKQGASDPILIFVDDCKEGTGEPAVVEAEPVIQDPAAFLSGKVVNALPRIKERDNAVAYDKAIVFSLSDAHCLDEANFKPSQGNVLIPKKPCG